VNPTVPPGPVELPQAKVEPPQVIPQAAQLVSPSPILKRILVGHDAGGSRPVYWEFGHDQLSNRHLLIFGSSGMGKTYAIQGILCELGKEGQNSVIVDYTNGFEDNQLDPLLKEHLKPTQHRVQWEPVPINPFRRQISQIGNTSQPEKVVTTAERIKSVFGDVYALGDQQKSALYSVVKAGIESFGDEMCLDKLPDLLQAVIDAGGQQQQYAASVFSKIQPFVDAKPFGQEKPGSWDAWYSDVISRCHILQLVGSSKDFARLVTEFSLIDLYWFYRGSGSKDRARVVVLDEVQNLSHKLESPLGGLLTEGRKFGFALILATQTLSNLKQDEQDRMFQAAHKLFFKPAETEVQEYASILANSTNGKTDLWVQRLSSLKKGECYSHGPSLNQAGVLEPKCFRIKIPALINRFNKGSS
jgi:DNA phosphorothioation-dependent restriction protein DptH